MSKSECGENDLLISKSCRSSSEQKFENDDFLSIKKRKLSKEDDFPPVLCHICKQNTLDPKTKFFHGLPDGALEEEAALTDDRLQLYSDGELIPEIDYKPIHKVTCFTVFDGEGHLCPFDTGLIERDELIFFSGYIKPIYDDDPSPKNGVPAQELGPIVEWWISGFDGGNSFLLAFRTPCAEYILMEPSPEYYSFMRIPKQKALLTKIVIEFLSFSGKPTYEELLNRINEVSVPHDIEPFGEESLRCHAQFIIDQVREVDDRNKLLSTPAAQEMIKVFKVKVRNWVRKKSHFKSAFKGTTTPLVYRNFEFFFSKKENSGVNGVQESPSKPPILSSDSRSLSKFSWEENSDFAIVNEETITVKDFVVVNTGNGERENRIFRIEYFFQQNFTKQIHCMELIRGSDTILGDASDPVEFFFLEECSDWPICKITNKINVTLRSPSKRWREFFDYHPPLSTETVFVQKKYSKAHGLFEDYEESSKGVCGVCTRKKEKEAIDVPILIPQKADHSSVNMYDKVIWREEEYSPGCCIFLEPFSVVFDAQKSCRRIEKTLVTLKTDEMIYPEIYRKAKEVNLTEECPEPFVVAYIKNIYSRSEGSQKKLFLTVNKFYRPENTRVLEAWDRRLQDLQLLYWSEEETEVSFDHVRGRCDVMLSQTAPEVALVNQFYFNSGFNSEKEAFYEVKDVVVKRKLRERRAVGKLKTLNVFSGCGGLAEGLRQSGVADIVWAIENDKPTCNAFKSNFPDVMMFEKDCNLFLKEVLSGRVMDENRNRYPKRGDVELLCGGPPCQGFSTMNRFSSKEDSQYNNSLIITYLSFCDYYRPKFFVLENVRNFVSYRKSVFFKHVLACLVAMGYQCAFGVIQAGNFGIPQIRRRVFIMGAAPGQSLPNFPKPTHVFYGPFKNFEYEVNGVNYCCRFSKVLSGSAPYRNVTIRDAIFDLTPMTKSSKCRSPGEKNFYRKFLMGLPSEVEDHVSKDMSAINEARVKHIPTSKGCDWRDLPNIRVRLRDGRLTELLKYTHHDSKNGKSCCGLLRGVCDCASGKPCDSKGRQNNTLIPWFLVHTANRNNNWTGLYGRLDWEGVFNTVTTNPEPSSKQGKVLHPEEDRIISVRECARAQGMPDSFRYHGTVAEKYRQVGNAVPPPLARAIGSEIKRSLMSKGYLEDLIGGNLVSES